MPESKVCASCGREMQWRSKWADNWDAVRYCSDACRRRGVTDVDRRLEETIIELLDKRAATSTICPSDAARAIGGDEWRDLMDPTRQAAARLVAQGLVDVTQGGEVVDVTIARGPVRIRRRTSTRP